MKKKFIFLFIFILLTPSPIFEKNEAKKGKKLPISEETSACLECHKLYTPGIVEDWQRGLHSKITPSSALKKSEKSRKISAQKVPAHLDKVIVGCFECHGLNPDKHKDNFEHNGFKINIVVSPRDCGICHPAEEKQYSRSKKAHAFENLTKNPVYHTLVETIISNKIIERGLVFQKEVSDFTRQETCFGCHGTEVKVAGSKSIKTESGELHVPQLLNWPNQGVGRINPDGSLGACTPCHPRHQFSIEVARKPYTCSQCHLEPDVPAWNVYKESKHGNIYFSNEAKWNFNAVLWTIGKDFQTPTCATCHNSLLTNSDGKVVVERTHDFGSRLWIRLFGLIYSHPQPIEGDTSKLKNKEGFPLPTSLKGESAQEGLINQKEQLKRKNQMSRICSHCHSTTWVTKHFEKLENTIKEVDQMIIASTSLLLEAWNQGLAEGIPQGKNPFDESIEQMWIRQWLFYANSVKYASAMTGAPDYATFKNGWWNLSENLKHMKDWIEFKKK